MKTIVTKHFPPKGYKAIYLFGLLFVRKGAVMTTQDLRHERIHQAQAREMAYIPFYLWYVLEWIVRLIQYKGNTKEAYRNISFEREAYANQDDSNYFIHREAYDWTLYL